MPTSNNNIKRFFEREEIESKAQAIFTKWAKKEPNTPNIIHIIPKSEENLIKGGLGKTSILYRLMYKFYEAKLEEAKLEESKLNKLFIDFAQQNMTKGGIVEEVMQKLIETCTILYPKLSFPKDEKEIVENVAIKEEEVKCYVLRKDPFQKKWEQLIDILERIQEVSLSEIQNYLPLVLFFDSYDIQYLGEQTEDLRNWLEAVLINEDKENKQGLFATLLQYGIKIVLTGRDKIGEKANVLTEIEIGLFDKNELKDFINQYTKKVIEKHAPENPIDISQIQTFLESHIEQIINFTGCRPILAALFCDFLLKYYLEHQTIEGFLTQITEQKNGNNDENQKFISYALFHLHEKAERNPVSLRGFIELMTIARYRVTPGMYQSFRESYLPNDIETIHDHLNELDKAYCIAMNGWKNLSFIKIVSDDNEYPILRLHDEYLDWYKKYYWAEEDESHEIRNAIVQFVGHYYEKSLIPNAKSIEEKEYYTVEKFDAWLRYRNRGETDEMESNVIQAFMYAFIRNLDESESLCDKLVNIAEAYFEERLEDKQMYPISNRLRYDMVEIPLRRAEYLLTVKGHNWKIRLDDKLEQVREFMKINENVYNKIVKNIEKYELSARIYGVNELDIEQQQVLAKCAIFEAEKWIWEDPKEIKHAQETINIANRICHRTEKRIWTSWSIHLEGFAYQRIADFDRARNLHAKAIASAYQNILHIYNKKAYQNGKSDNDKSNLKDIIDYRDQYRLFFLMRIIARAYGNMGLNIRYTSQLMESLGVYETLLSFLVTSEMKLGREMQRHEVNLQDRRIPLNLNYDYKHGSEILKDVALDSIIKNRMKVIKFKKEYALIAKSGIAWQYRANYYHETVKKIEKETIHTISQQLGETRKNLQLSRGQALDKKTRENAELHYIDAKAYLDYGQIKEAEQQLNFSLNIAADCLFQYSEVEALGSLYNLKYLQQYEVGNNNHKMPIEFEMLNYEKAFQEKIRQLESEDIVYNDLMARYYNTKGNNCFDEAIKAQMKQKSKYLTEAMLHYVDMIIFAIEHNENRYNVALSVIAERIWECREVFIDKKQNAVQYCIDILKKGLNVYILRDPFLKNYLLALEKVASIKIISPSSVEDEMDGVRTYIRDFIYGAHFTKARFINRLLIKLFEEIQKKHGKEALASLVFGYFNEFYCYWITRESKKAERTINKAKDLIKKIDEDKPKKKALEGVMEIADAINLYWNGEYWNLEKFILGELYHHRKQYYNDVLKDKGIKWNDIVVKFQTGIRAIVEYIAKFPKEATKKRNAYLRILSSGYENLGQLYLLLDAETSIVKEQEQDNIPVYPLQNYVEGIKNDEIIGLLKQIGLNTNSSLKTDCVAVSYLDAARIIAKEAEDKHRELNQLEMMFNAKYFAGQDLMDKNFHANDFSMEIGTAIYTKENSKQMPFVVSKYLLVMADSLFTTFFEIHHSSYYLYYKGEASIVILQYKRKKGEWTKEDKAKIREMLRHYLCALDLLSRDTVYHTLEFSNIYLEIKDRILLVHDIEYLQVLEDGFMELWGTMPYLVKREQKGDRDIYEDLIRTIQIHKASLMTADLFRQ